MNGSINLETNSRIERVILLGFFPLLASTTTGWLALGAGIIILTSVGLVFFTNMLVTRFTNKLDDSYRWAILLVGAFVVSWLLSQAIPFLLPTPRGMQTILLLSGMTPFVFRPGIAQFNPKAEVKEGILLLGLLLGLGLLREYLGRATMFGYLLPPYYVTPLGLFAEPLGGFALLATLVLGSRLITNVRGAAPKATEAPKAQEVQS
jgi:hypothetical protein